MRNFSIKTSVPTLFLAVLLVAGFSTNVIAGNGPINFPPLCDAGGSYVIECQGTSGLDGTGSSDPDGDPLTYAWGTDCPGGSFDDPTSPTPQLTVDSPPSCNAFLTVTDDDGASDTCSATVSVVDTIPPDVNCTGTTVPAESPEGAQVDVLALFESSDTCGGTQFVCVPDSGLFPIGNTAVECTATDDSGNTNTCSLTVQVSPLNDECTDAFGPLDVASVTPGTSAGATSDSPPAPASCGVDPVWGAPVNTNNGVWYTVVGTGNTMTASTCNDLNPDTGSASYDTQISIFCADCEDMTCVDGDDDFPGCAGFSSYISWKSQVGATYLILVHGFGGATGNFELAILDDDVPVEADVVCKVDIDIKPGSFPNSINTSKCKGKIPVAILGNAFDVTTVDVTTLAFGPDGAYPAHDLTDPDTHYDHLQDVDYDLDTDLVSHYQCQETGIAAGDTEACLSFSTLGTDPGSDCFEPANLLGYRQGCDDSACETAVCAVDPFCCNDRWDSVCVSEVATFCGPVNPDSDCLVEAPPIFDRQGCDDSACETEVCAVESFCCDVGWAGGCDSIAGELCPVSRSFESCDSVRTVPSQ